MGAGACTSACTKSTDSAHAEAVGAGDAETAGGPAGPAGEHFAEALTMLARLPLTDAERAEAVRRLLANGDR